MAKSSNHGIQPSSRPRPDRGGIIHVANIKGGVGKSTVATNLAACLAEFGPTLLVDLDAQGSASHALGSEPAGPAHSSYRLFAQSLDSSFPANSWSGGRTGSITRKLSVRPRPTLSDLTQPVAKGLDLIPASSSLLSPVGGLQSRRFVNNLRRLRSHYRYIVLDTPSVWNRFMQDLFRACDLNLIPVTLRALSTRSLKDYLKEIRKLMRRHPTIRIRIVKNEVVGGSRLMGKGKTISENRAFLASLCEMIRYSSGQSTLLLPQSVVFGLEIPEASAIQNAQDRGTPVVLEKGNTAAKRSFHVLCGNTRDVLNSLPATVERVPFHERPVVLRRFFQALPVAAAFLLFARPVAVIEKPSPAILAPSQLEITTQSAFSHTLGPDDNIYRLAKYGICRFRAMVPSKEQVENYVSELIDIYNYTRMPEERRIPRSRKGMTGITMSFYPPSGIANPSFGYDSPIYEFFCSMVKDPYSYITGVWCEYGEGGGQPHKGIDVAGPMGTPIISPLDGVAYNRRSPHGGNMVGVVAGDYVLFFAHLMESRVSDGTRVRKGDVIGTLGISGRASGPHVHVGYGLRYPLPTPLRFHRTYYTVTDPKQFFYRMMYEKNKSIETPGVARGVKSSG